MTSQGSEGAEAQSTTPAGSGSGPLRPCAAIFDFDRCIMKHHMWAKFNTAKLANIPIGDADFGDVAFFRKLIPALHGSGVQVAIATFGRQDVALKAMRQAFGEDQTFFSTRNVSTPKDFGAIEGSDSLEDKNTQLKALSELLGVAFQDMVFFDDSPLNITNAKVLGVNAISAKPFSTKIWESNGVSDWFTQRGVTLSLA